MQASLLAGRDPDAQAQPVPQLADGRDQVAVLLVAVLERAGRLQQAVGVRHDPAVAVDAGPDELLVGRVVAPEHGRDAVLERGRRDAAAGGQQREDGPFDAVGERRPGGLDVGRVAQPPAPRLDLHQARVIGPMQLGGDAVEGDAGPGSAPVSGLDGDRRVLRAR